MLVAAFDHFARPLADLAGRAPGPAAAMTAPLDGVLLWAVLLGLPHGCLLSRSAGAADPAPDPDDSIRQPFCHQLPSANTIVTCDKSQL
ncbi:hypothetical protein RKLH11_3016 [Rhodobacteraceae bacterium KLH11]|nr:hypothetical protein RKLH11_3016 [Rhodobacteraceae bacterium KLH11]